MIWIINCCPLSVRVGRRNVKSRYFRNFKTLVWLMQMNSKSIQHAATCQTFCQTEELDSPRSTTSIMSLVVARLSLSLGRSMQSRTTCIPSQWPRRMPEPSLDWWVITDASFPSLHQLHCRYSIWPRRVGCTTMLFPCNLYWYHSIDNKVCFVSCLRVEKKLSRATEFKFFVKMVSLLGLFVVPVVPSRVTKDTEWEKEVTDKAMRGRRRL